MRDTTLNLSGDLIDIEKQEGGTFDYDDFTDQTPEWAKKENAHDSNGRDRRNPDYDPTTLYVPPEFWSNKRLTPAMRQYWEIKSQNNDKIVLF